MTAIYLDHNATTPLCPAAAAAMRAAETGAFGNPSSAHAAGRKARQQLEEARESVAEVLGAKPDEVTFTSGATEANNLAVFGLTREAGNVVTSPLEHPCVVEPVKQLAAGFEVRWLPVNAAGVVEQSTVVKHVDESTRLVAVQLVNHETGAIQPVRHIAKTLPKGVPVHCDAAQAVGKLPVHFRDLGVTTLSASGHKFGGPKGVGVLLVRGGSKVRPQMYGGHQQRGVRPGTESVALAAGFAAALRVAVAEMEANAARLTHLRDLFRSSLPAGHVVNSPPDALPTTLNVSFPGCRSELLLMALDLAGVACSTGSACSSGSLLPSPVLLAMGVPDDVLQSAMRFSFSPIQSDAEVIAAATQVRECVGRLGGDARPSATGPVC